MTSTVDTGPSIADPSTWRGRALVPVLVYIGLLVAVVSSLGAPLIPTIAADYGVSLGTAQWSLTITLLVGAVSSPAIGRLGDGPRRLHVLLAALAVLVAGSVLAALPTDVFALLLAGRAMQGVGLALLPLAMSMARDHLEPERPRGPGDALGHRSRRRRARLPADRGDRRAPRASTSRSGSPPRSA